MENGNSLAQESSQGKLFYTSAYFSSIGMQEESLCLKQTEVGDWLLAMELILSKWSFLFLFSIPSISSP